MDSEEIRGTFLFNLRLHLWLAYNCMYMEDGKENSVHFSAYDPSTLYNETVSAACVFLIIRLILCYSETLSKTLLRYSHLLQQVTVACSIK